MDSDEAACLRSPLSREHTLVYALPCLRLTLRLTVPSATKGPHTAPNPLSRDRVVWQKKPTRVWCIVGGRAKEMEKKARVRRQILLQQISHSYLEPKRSTTEASLIR